MSIKQAISPHVPSVREQYIIPSRFTTNFHAASNKFEDNLKSTPQMIDVVQYI